jgi:hypothetical protein
MVASIKLTVYWMIFALLGTGAIEIGTVPEIFVIGSAKSGTSTLSYILSHHPDICSSETKEAHFFDNDAHYSEGMRRYADFFNIVQEPDKSACKYHVDATPSYIRHPHVPQRINDSFTRAQLASKKFVLILRDPVLRECSWYFHMADFCVTEVADKLRRSDNRDPAYLCEEKPGSRSGVPHCGLMGCEGRVHNITLSNVRHVVDPFEKYIYHRHYDLSGSFYDVQIKWWLQYISRSQLFIINMDDLLRNPRDVTKRLFSFLGIADTEITSLPHSNGHGNYLCGCDGLKMVDEWLSQRNVSQNTLKLIREPGKPADEPEFSPFNDKMYLQSKHCTSKASR